MNKTEVDDKILIDGSITRDNWAEICDICLQTAYIDQKREENLKFKMRLPASFMNDSKRKRLNMKNRNEKGIRVTLIWSWGTSSLRWRQTITA